MVERTMEIGVLVSRRPLTGPWGGVSWRPFGVVLDVPPIAPWTLLRHEGDVEIFYAGPSGLTLYPAETGHYRDNLAAEQPSVWVALRPNGDEPGEIITTTVDPYEGESLADTIEDAVEAVPMPEAIKAWVSAYFAENHVERPFFKRQRDRANPEAFGRGGPRAKTTPDRDENQ